MSKVEYQTSLSAISGLMLSHIRKAMGLGQADMGKLFNMSHATYRSIEKGETAINADFIFMLCGIIEKKPSFYFEILEDIAEHLTKVEKDIFNSDCFITLIPNGDFQKILNSYTQEDYVTAPHPDRINILIDQDIYMLFTPILRLKLVQLTDKAIIKDQFKAIVKITSDEVGEVVQTLKENKNNDKTIETPHSASALALLGTLVSPVGLPILAGLGLYEAYKKSKESKKK